MRPVGIKLMSISSAGMSVLGVVIGDAMGDAIGEGIGDAIGDAAGLGGGIVCPSCCAKTV